MKTFYTFILAFLWALSASAQHSLPFSENFGTTATYTSKVTTTGAWGRASTSGNFYLQTPSSNNGSTPAYTVTIRVSTAGYRDINVQWREQHTQGNGNNIPFTRTIAYSVGDQTKTYYTNSVATSAGFVSKSAPLSSEPIVNNRDIVEITFTVTKASGNDNQFAMDDIRVTGTPISPSIILSSTTTPLAFESTTPGLEIVNSYSLSGMDLYYGIVTITAPATIDEGADAEFLVSLTQDGEFVKSLTITPEYGVISSKPIYVRFKSFKVGNYNDVIQHDYNKGELAENLAVQGTQSNITLAPLPVELASFQGQSQDGATQLAWTTATEQSNEKFVVERSLDGKRFVEIGEVKGKGNSASRLNYNFTDKAPVGGTNYYRLRQVDFDGTSTYSNIVALEVAGKGAEIAVYPTVATQAITISLPNISGNTAISIVDITGRTVATFTSVTEQEIELPVHSFRNGVYFVKVSDGQNQLVQRFIKQ